MKKFTWIVQFFVLASFAQLPDTDIWLYKLGKTKKGVILKEGKNITSRPGYDNQPYFTSDGRSVYFVSIREDKQSDIYRYDLRSKKIIQVTKTATSEYSPMLTPDEKKMSVVMVETDSTQRLWTFDYNVKNETLLTEKNETLLIENVDSVGYYAWLNKDSLLYYKLTEPHSLHALSVSTGKDAWICNAPTRAFKPTKNRNFFYVIKGKDGNEVRIYNYKLKKTEVLTTVKPETEDFIYDKNLGLVKSEGSKLMRFDERLKMWMEVADFSSSGIKKITRFAISNDGRWLAIVDNK
jgi:hypothetical protein